MVRTLNSELKRERCGGDKRALRSKGDGASRRRKGHRSGRLSVS